MATGHSVESWCHLSCAVELKSQEMDIKIETPRLCLRTLQEEDVSQAYVDWLNDPEVNRYLETRHALQTLASCSDFVKRCNSEKSEHLLGVFLRESQSHIGNVKLGFIDDIHSRGQISLFIGEKTLWGRGFAREIVYAITKYGFEEAGLERIEAGCYEENLSSLRVFLSVGYTVEGFFRSHAVSESGRRTGCFWMGLLKHDFKLNQS
jgi:ribosomal-protein-alanine N-acetyltransferase